MKIYKLEFYVPKNDVEKVKRAVLERGAGRIGNYDYCCWQTVDGIGQFRPLHGSNPYIGEENKVEHVEEIKVEMICSEEFITKVIEALKESHPYETPAFQYWEIKTD